MEVSAHPLKRQFKKRSTTIRRHDLVREKINEYYTRKIDGIRLDYDCIVAKVAKDMGYSERYVKDILKN